MTDPLDQGTDVGLYIHWPYCSRICPYCDFNVVRDRGRAEEQAALADAVLADLEAQAALANRAVLRRFAAMRDWSGLAGGGVGPDELHLNDEGYACWAEITAEGLARAILDASNP